MDLFTIKLRQRNFRFSALQRAEIAEIVFDYGLVDLVIYRFSALQRAEIAEMPSVGTGVSIDVEFQCSSTSRNC